MPFYGVRNGRKPGVYSTWAECLSQVSKFSNPDFRKFATKEAAWKYVLDPPEENSRSNDSVVPSEPHLPTCSSSPLTKTPQLPVVTNNSTKMTDRDILMRIARDVEELKNVVANIANQVGVVFNKIDNTPNVKISIEGAMKRSIFDAGASSSTTSRCTFTTHAPAAVCNLNDQEIPPPPKKTAKLETFDQTDTSLGEFLTDEDGYVKVYTDGACENNGRKNAKAGIGVWFNEKHPLNCSEPVIGRATNNNAEIQAAVQAIQLTKSSGLKKVLIFTDSEFLINCITKWIKGWKTNGWKTAAGKDVKNKEELKLLEEVMKGMDVKWSHVRGHMGIHGNEMADLLARRGAEKYHSESTS